LFEIAHYTANNFHPSSLFNSAKKVKVKASAWCFLVQTGWPKTPYCVFENTITLDLTQLATSNKNAIKSASNGYVCTTIAPIHWRILLKTFIKLMYKVILSRDIHLGTKIECPKGWRMFFGVSFFKMGMAVNVQ
jgi:hypothetical protein